jgi:hypothetical protein
LINVSSCSVPSPAGSRRISRLKLIINLSLRDYRP